jgi:hypothetical protein
MITKQATFPHARRTRGARADTAASRNILTRTPLPVRLPVRLLAPVHFRTNDTLGHCGKSAGTWSRKARACAHRRTRDYVAAQAMRVPSAAPPPTAAANAVAGASLARSRIKHGPGLQGPTRAGAPTLPRPATNNRSPPVRLAGAARSTLIHSSLRETTTPARANTPAMITGTTRSKVVPP